MAFELIDIKGVTELAGVDASTVSKWARFYADFPNAAGRVQRSNRGGPLTAVYPKDEVVEFLRRLEMKKTTTYNRFDLALARQFIRRRTHEI